MKYTKNIEFEIPSDMIHLSCLDTRDRVRDTPNIINPVYPVWIRTTDEWTDEKKHQSAAGDGRRSSGPTIVNKITVGKPCPPRMKVQIGNTIYRNIEISDDGACFLASCGQHATTTSPHENWFDLLLKKGFNVVRTPSGICTLCRTTRRNTHYADTGK